MLAAETEASSNDFPEKIKLKLLVTNVLLIWTNRMNVAQN